MEGVNEGGVNLRSNGRVTRGEGNKEGRILDKWVGGCEGLVGKGRSNGGGERCNLKVKPSHLLPARWSEIPE